MGEHTREKGDWGEEVASRYLINNNYRILHRNYRTAVGEVDIIANVERTVVFVEVKSARKEPTVAPELRINAAKQRRLYRIANHYIANNPRDDADYQMDVIVVIGTSNKYRIRHHKNAFYLL